MQQPRRVRAGHLLAICVLLWGSGVRARRTAAGPAARVPKPPTSQAAEHATEAVIDALDRAAAAGSQENSTHMVLATEGALHDQGTVLNKTLAELQSVEVEGLKLVDKKVSLEKEVQSERVEEASLEDDKKALLKTVQDVMRTNQTKVQEEQVRDLSKLEKGVQERCAEEQQDLQARLQKAAARIEHAEAARKKAGVVAQALQEQQTEMTSATAKLQAEITDLRQQAADAEADKGVAMESLRSLLRENAQFKQEAEDKHSTHTTPGQLAKVARPKLRRRAVAAATGSDDTAIMGETTAMDSYMAKVHSSSNGDNAALPHLLARRPVARRVDAVARKPALPHKTGLAKWLYGDASRPTRKAATHPPEMTSPLDAFSDLVAPAQGREGFASQVADSDDGGPGSASAAFALLRRAEESLSS